MILTGSLESIIRAEWANDCVVGVICDCCYSEPNQHWQRLKWRKFAAIVVIFLQIAIVCFIFEVFIDSGVYLTSTAITFIVLGANKRNQTRVRR